MPADDHAPGTAGETGTECFLSRTPQVQPDPRKPQRRNIRLRHYDYSLAGAYFITVVTQDRQCLFGEVQDAEMRLNDAGRMVADQWQSLPRRFRDLELDAFVIMPNHLHGILLVTRTFPVTEPTTTVAPTVGDIVGAFKSITTVGYIHGVARCGWPRFRTRLWQRNYYEHIIRNEESLHHIREYIVNNPAQWATDPENPTNPSP
ncbi:MAG: hypothetical protein KatS3mg015_3165 [Fimbriimonadales bacterium]|nr:MAG: hypothetical protein KatS3mg015_3165 [Fimbriimonadales bacterium]